MKKRLIALTVMLLSIAPSMGQTKSDTLYYGKDGKGVQTKDFASFYRVLLTPADSNYSKMMRDYYLSGKLRGEGQFLSIDRYDDQKSVFDGQCTQYYENGLILSRSYYKNGVLDGIYSRFSDDGSHCTQVEYDNGEYRYDYYIVSNDEGCCTKFSLADDKPIFEPVNINERKTELLDGEKWSTYLKNGMLIRAYVEDVKDYGKYYRIPIEIANKSIVPMDFDPSKITAYCLNKQGKELPLHVYSAKEYIAKVDRKQNWDKFVNESTEYSHAQEAGYSSSVTTTDAAHQGATVARGVTSIQSKNGSVLGGYSSGSVTTGNSSSVSVTESYNAALAYQARLVADQRTANFNYSLDQKRMVMQEGYLKPTTIYPGQAISGYINVEYKKGTEITINVDVNGVYYQFSWQL